MRFVVLRDQVNYHYHYKAITTYVSAFDRSLDNTEGDCVHNVLNEMKTDRSETKMVITAAESHFKKFPRLGNYVKYTRKPFVVMLRYLYLTS